MKHDMLVKFSLAELLQGAEKMDTVIRQEVSDDLKQLGTPANAPLTIDSVKAELVEDDEIYFRVHVTY